jgi:hypothetical protein
MREVLAPHVVERRASFLRVKVGDGEADIYLDGDDAMTVNHISGRDPWDLPLRGAHPPPSALMTSTPPRRNRPV